jgi:hypothetical protein
MRAICSGCYAPEVVDPDSSTGQDYAVPPILFVIVLAVVTGYALGGRLRHFEHLRVHWWALAFAGVGLQALPVPRIDGVDPQVVGAAMLVLSYVLLLAFLTVNRWVPAAGVMAIGLLMNLAVVGINGGMPVSPSAVRTAGGSPELVGADLSSKHHLMGANDVLGPLGDVIPLPRPAGVVLSIGDLLLYAGMAWFVVQVMRGRSRENPRPLAMWFLAYRGKHAPGYWRMPARYRAADPAEAARSGTAP